MPDAGCRMPDAGCRMHQNDKSSDTRFKGSIEYRVSSIQSLNLLPETFTLRRRPQSRVSTAWQNRRDIGGL